ncbi:amidase signature domain-containing protein [Geopyxis carbonaria]|nr:amidase signature domain-containing protein [Geopyxis carbonaria]
MASTQSTQLGRYSQIPYYTTWSLSAWSYDQTKSKDEYLPLTVVQTNETRVSADVIKIAFERYNRTDDVWSSLFTEDENFVKNVDAETVLLSSHFTNSKAHCNSTVPEGPYFLNTYTGRVHAAYRLYADTHQAFIQSSYQSPTGTHHPLSAGISAAGSLTIAVPSKLYTPRTPEKPLGGVRLAVKDLYDLDGLTTSFGNSALFSLSSPATTTAAAVSALISAGAVVVGKNKLSEFAFAGGSQMDHIDYLLPFNPRGDGYNSPGSSSGGSAASVAAYDWLDLSIGSDTGGSIRGPAAQNGVFGNRPSQDAVDLTGAGVLSKSMDTAGLFARDPELWSVANRVLYAKTSRTYTALPTKLYTSELFSGLSQQPLIETFNKFIEAASNLLNATAEDVSLDALWAASPPASLTNTSIANITTELYSNLTQYEQWIHTGRPFLTRYAAANNGELPWVTPSTLDGWMNANATMDAATNARALAIKKAAAQWSEETFLRRSNESCSDGLFIYPYYPLFQFKPFISPQDSNPSILQLGAALEEAMTAAAACAPKNSTAAGVAPEQQEEIPVSTQRFASIAGLPDYVLTLASYNGPETFSNKSMTTQDIPYGIGIVAARGCDFVILDVVEKLTEMGVVRSVKAGSKIA